MFRIVAIFVTADLQKPQLLDNRRTYVYDLSHIHSICVRRNSAVPQAHLLYSETDKHSVIRFSLQFCLPPHICIRSAVGLFSLQITSNKM